VEIPKENNQMLYFEQLRCRLNKNQQKMADACGIARTTWQLIEYGAQLPSSRVAQVLYEMSGVVVPCESDCLTTVQRRQWRRQRPFELAAAAGDTWTRVHRHCQNMLGLYEKIDPKLLSWMEQLLPLESVPEGFNLLQFAYDGAQAFLDNPHELGYRTQALVDAQGKTLGERKLPGLRGKLGEVHYLLWPQVRIRPIAATFRVDGLMLLSLKSKSHWSTMEVDGPHHDQELDRKRRELLRLPELRITVAEVERFQSVTRMSEQALKLFAA